MNARFDHRECPASRRFLIVDGHAYAYRAFYAIRSLNSPSGTPTNAIYGFIKMLARMRELLAPTHLTVVWDGGLSPERIVALPEYKAQRPPMPNDLAGQIDQIFEYLAAVGLSSLQQDAVEADDWIAGLANQARAENLPVVIASADKDFMQLVSSGVGLLNPNDKSETVWTAEQVRAKAGVGPEAIVDWLALVGDSVDNIPGVPGVGPKTAADLLNRFGSVDQIYQRLGEVKSERLRSALTSAEAAVRRNQALVRLKVELPVPWDLPAFAGRESDRERLRSLYARWGFRTLLKEIEASAPAQGELL